MLGKLLGFFICVIVILFGFYLLMTKEQKRIEKKAHKTNKAIAKELNKMFPTGWEIKQDDNKISIHTKLYVATGHLKEK